jgi:hypothetical protein
LLHEQQNNIHEAVAIHIRKPCRHSVSRIKVCESTGARALPRLTNGKPLKGRRREARGTEKFLFPPVGPVELQKTG